MSGGNLLALQRSQAQQVRDDADLQPPRAGLHGGEMARLTFGMPPTEPSSLRRIRAA